VKPEVKKDFERDVPLEEIHKGTCFVDGNFPVSGKPWFSGSAIFSCFEMFGALLMLSLIIIAGCNKPFCYFYFCGKFGKSFKSE
jgi:hypothetical protein